MPVSFEIFKQAVEVLKGNEYELVVDSYASVQSHRYLIEQRYNQAVYMLKTMFVKFRKYENQHGIKKLEIWQKETEPWVPLLKIHQQTTVFPKVKSETVNRLLQGKQAIEDLSSSISELQLRLIGKAKEVKILMLELKTTDTRLVILDTAIDLKVFLNLNQYEPADLADYELQKYYEQFIKGGGDSG